ncbi:MAG: hypothetical protein H7301_02195 [Cryobacterium sp.]|nr:hypothetical protein [Oligoflexia bacterium]
MKNTTGIAVLGATLFTIASLGLVSPQSAHAKEMTPAQTEMENYFTVDQVLISELKGNQESFISSEVVSPHTAVSEAKKNLIDPSIIVAVGSKVFDMVLSNGPVVTENYSPSSALPAGMTSWTELEGWKEPANRTFRLVFTNLYKQKVVEFVYHVAYTYGGNYNGVGQYLSRVEIEPATINVLWGYKLDVRGAVLNVMNAGTRENPMARIDLRLDWSVSNLLKHTQSSIRYSVQGDGLFKSYSDGSIASKLK